uniref:SEC7 domain-containing protein n=1 Tax=Kwoniella dejecticola CBS 10117 TaxID=1296121 RepID=A0A1A6AD94_9TREE|nr:uncharacterized protein I303_02254 [Kwoniella dejecticola CBS 10117]OBR88036.1 hypothetical protein I303_02254 [Kwoniella dejecticola CBS 10117]
MKSPSLSTSTRSPNPISARAPSPNLPHRPSTSSNRSLRRSEADFEAALLDTKSTIFLSASPGTSSIAEDEEPKSAGSGLGLGPAPSILRKKSKPKAESDPNAPLPIEKTSFEEDLNNLKIGGQKGLGILMETPTKSTQDKNGNPDTNTNGSIGIIPPTPSTVGTKSGRHNRRSSQMTTDSGYQSSNYSDTTNGTPGKRRPSKSLGIDAELGEKPIPKSHQMPPKRRSIFRSPGTASSPDLATLVRKAKEAKSTPHPPPTELSTPNHAESSTAASARNRERSTTNPRANDEHWERYGNMLGGNQMASIAEGSGTIGSGGRSRQNSEEGFKSMRNKARGVFGKMFGSSKDHHLPPTTPPSATSSRFPAESGPRPPVPPVPSAYIANHRKAPSPPDESVEELDHNQHARSQSSRSVSASTISGPRQGSPNPGYDGRTSVTPTGDRRVSGNSNLSFDKPLPALVEPENHTPQRTPSSTLRISGHTRQPASTAEEDSPPSLEPPLKPSASPATRAVHTFKSDMAGMLEDIGQTDPAKELGLPPDSIRRGRDRTTSNETARNEPLRSRFPAELGKSPSLREHDRNHKTHLSPVPAQRTSSLPSNSPQLDRMIPKRTTSSPSPNPSLNGDSSAGLMPNQPVISRSSSRSSGKKSVQLGSPSQSAGPSPNRSPSLSKGTNKYFDELNNANPATNSGSKRSSPLMPSSVRLVSSPQDSQQENSPFNLASALQESGSRKKKSSFRNASPWGKQTPRMMSAPNTYSNPSLINTNRDDQLEVVNTPPETPKTAHEEDEEEKGRRLACEFLEDDFTNVPGEKVAEFLGGPRPVNAIALKYYMQYFDMKSQSLVDSFSRDLCQKLHLKAESQEIDRIIEAFSARYYECNPSTVYGTSGVVHTVTAAMLMLNTDLHIAELNKHMSRNDFVRNAMRAIHESLPSAERDGDGTSTPDLVRDDGSSMKAGFGSNGSMAPSFVSVRAKPPSSVLAPPTQRSASAPVISQGPSRTDSASSIGTTGVGIVGGKGGSSTTVSSFTYNRAWEMEAENALREIFASVKADRILLPISGPTQNNRQSMISISSNGPFDRARTVRSPSDRVNALKRGSIRGVQGLLNNPYGSTWSASDGRLSPTPSYATSINEVTDGGGQGLGSFAPTLGFASNLSHTVIREHDDEVRSVDSNTSEDTAEDMDDDELALLGAPWAKEGLLSRKLYWESINKRAKKNDWKQFFVVISKGELYMFTFGERGGGGMGFAMGGSVGGGNWLENANANGQISLMHTMSVALPKPGYNANRPYCFSLATPSGETSFFQAGTEDLVQEWVSTCNYWAARKSRQPLKGGVSNMEYGWNRAAPISSPPLDPHSHAHDASADDDRASVRSSRSNLSKLNIHSGTYGSYGRKTPSNANDKIYINDWKPPPPATMPSPLDEEAQLEALQNYVRSLVEELESHKAVEEPMNKLYSPGSKNLIKARENWKAKSHYIHTEIFKYETYVEALRNAISLRVKKQGEKKLEKSLARSMTSLHRQSSASEHEKDDEEDEGEFESTFKSQSKSAKLADQGEEEEEDDEGYGTPNVNDTGTIRR